MVGNLPLMEQINDIAQKEKDTNVPILEAGIQFWTGVADLLERNHRALADAADRVAEQWRDPTHVTAFQDPVNGGLESLEKSVRTILQAKPQEAARKAIEEIEAITREIAEILSQYIEVYNLAVHIETRAKANPMGYEQQMLGQLEKKMQELEQQATVALKRMGTQGYAPATPPVKAAGENHTWNGSQSASSASAASAGGSGTVSASSDSGTPADLDTEAPDTIPIGTGEDFAQTHAEASTDTPSDLTLAGGPAPAPAPPVAASPPATPPAGPAGPGTGMPIAPVAAGLGARTAGIGRVPIIPTAAALGGARGTAGGQIPQAAKVPGGIVAANGKAPALPTDSAGTTAVSSARKPGMIGPMGAGVPPMLAPMAANSIQGLINRLKPILGRSALPRVEEPEKVAGVPRGLRGRTARTQDDDAFRPRTTQRNRRSSGTEAPPETVQLLDEEIWRVERAKAGNEALRSHR